MPTLADAITEWGKNPSTTEKLVQPNPFFSETLFEEKKKYETPFPLKGVKKAIVPKLTLPKFTTIDLTMVEVQRPAFSIVEPKTFPGFDSLFKVDKVVREHFNKFGCCNIPYHMSNNVKNKFGAEDVFIPALFRDIMERRGVTVENVYLGTCCVMWDTPNNIFIFPKKFFTYMSGNQDPYYENTLAHELIHITGSSKRLNRKAIATHVGVGERHKTRMEECIAIIGGELLLSKLGYTMSSVMSLKCRDLLFTWSCGDRDMLDEAEKEAEIAVNYLLNKDGVERNKWSLNRFLSLFRA